MQFIGIDTGYSKRKKTLGYAILAIDGNGVSIRSDHTNEAGFIGQLDRILAEHPGLVAAAIDSPLTELLMQSQPSQYPTKSARPQEHLFMQLAFQNCRVKPGPWMSPSRGIPLYHAGMRLKQALVAAGSRAERPFSFTNWRHEAPAERRIFESFPKTWLGMIAGPDMSAQVARVAANGHDYDTYLYNDLIAEQSRLGKWSRTALALDSARSAQLIGEMSRVINPDERAAVVSALTAAEGHFDTACWVGNTLTGHFLLPCRRAWDPAMEMHFAESLTCIEDDWSGLGDQGLIVWDECR